MMKRDLKSVHKENGALSAKDVARLINRREPVILEIGANIGQTTAEFLKEMPHARIFCFEPDPRAIAIFKENIKSPNVKLIECAVGNNAGNITFHQSSGVDEYAGWNQSGSIKPPKDHVKIWPKVTFENKIEVPVIRLDDWIETENLEQIDFIWADTQGAEGDMILGGPQAINKSRFLYTEYGFQEIYEGQVSLSEIDGYLGDFSILRLFTMDVLFENFKLKERTPNNFRRAQRVVTNALCPCGSGERYKNCHGKL